MAQTLSRLYSDIDLAFKRTPGKNDVSISYDEMAVIRSLRYLLLTNHYERPFQPNLGSDVEKLLFEPISPLTAGRIKTEIELVIQNYEPRVLLQEVTVYEKPDDNAYDVSLVFFIGNNSQPSSISLILERTR